MRTRSRFQLNGVAYVLAGLGVAMSGAMVYESRIQVIATPRIEKAHAAVASPNDGVTRESRFLRSTTVDLRDLPVELPEEAAAVEVGSPTQPRPWAATSAVLDQLEAVALTHRHAPYFISYNREVTRLEAALRKLAESPELKRLPGSLARKIDEACYARLLHRDLWEIKVNPLKTRNDIAEFIAGARIRVSCPTPRSFKGIGPDGAAGRTATYESAARSLLEESATKTLAAREEFSEL